MPTKTPSENQRTNDADVLPEEILAALLYHAWKHARDQGRTGKDQRYQFRGHDYTIQKKFEELTEHFPILKEYFPSARTGPDPFSPVLNDSITRLQLAGLIARQNPDYQVMLLNPEVKAFYENRAKEKIESKLGRERLKELQEAGSEFQEKFAEEE